MILLGMATVFAATETGWMRVVGIYGPFYLKCGIWGSDPANNSIILVSQKVKLFLLIQGGLAIEFMSW